MPSAGLLVAAVVAAVALFLTVRLTRTYLAAHGTRVVPCPENHRKAEVALDARAAALSGVLHAPVLRLRSCTRWPEKQNCGQDCLAQISEAGESCLLRNIVAGWYAGKSCVLCQRPIGEIDWATHKLGLMTPEGNLIGWAQVDAEQIDRILATHSPVCFPCHVTNTFVREHPEMIVDRSSRTT